MQLGPVLVYLSLLPYVLGALYGGLVNLKQDNFDFVIIGGKKDLLTYGCVYISFLGGTAGAVLANRLSEIQSFQVLVIEAGPRCFVVSNQSRPALLFSLTTALFLPVLKMTCLYKSHFFGTISRVHHTTGILRQLLKRG